MIATSIEDNVTLLQNAGFAPVDEFFRWYNFAGLIAAEKRAHPGMKP